MPDVVKVGLTGSYRTVNAKDGRTHVFTDVYIFPNGSPYPEKFQHYGKIDLPAGEYLAPLRLEVRNERLTCQIDFANAKAV